MELECDLGAIQNEELLRKMVSDVKVEVSKLHIHIHIYIYMYISIYVELQLICAYIRLTRTHIYTYIHK